MKDKANVQSCDASGLQLRSKIILVNFPIKRSVFILFSIFMLLPEYNPLRNSGHESGDFVFVRKQTAKKP